MRTIRALTRLGPREATSGAYREASDYVAQTLADLGYDITRQRFGVPAGTSWGVPVDAGRTLNVVARPPDLAPGTPYVLIGAHLDTVPQSPGAEDNASGIAVILELARLAEQHDVRLPLVLAAFGAEEPRGPADDEHHFGSQRYVREVGLDGLTAMVSLDRVGAGRRVPVCTGGLSPRRVQREILDVAERIGLPAKACDNRTSDHWPFEKAGATVARIGGNPSAGYHSPGDDLGNVDPRQVERTGTLVWEWLATR